MLESGVRYLPEGNENGEGKEVNMRKGGERVAGKGNEKWSPRGMEERRGEKV